MTCANCPLRSHFVKCIMVKKKSLKSSQDLVSQLTGNKLNGNLDIKRIEESDKDGVVLATPTPSV